MTSFANGPEEPPTSGQVVIETNYGKLEIDLWSKEIPKACRNFI
jgi:peptidyl-prolyl cis-trans isomerase SDCCAG10